MTIMTPNFTNMAYSKEADKTRAELIPGMCKQNTKTTPRGVEFGDSLPPPFRVSKLMGFDQCGSYLFILWEDGVWFFLRKVDF